MNIIKTLKAWLRPKDLSLVLEVEGALDGGINAAIHGMYDGMLEPQYDGKQVVLIPSNQTDDGKTRFYVYPAIRGRKDNISLEELRNLYPKALHITYYLESKAERATTKVLSTSLSY